MKAFKYLAVAAVAAVCMTMSSPKAQANQVSIRVGVAPSCPYGYFDYAPYDCAPYGYYGSEWYSGGVFIGAGPWFHGHSDFHGYVDNHYDRHYGYHGNYPHRGDRVEVNRTPGRYEHGHFSGNEYRDGRGHVVHNR